MAMETEAGSSVSGVATTGNVTSGTASEAMIKAATAVSSADSAPASPAGDTPAKTIPSESGAPPAATGPATQEGSAAPAAATRTEAPAGDRIPENRIIAAARNAREKTTADIEARYGIKGVSPDDVKVALSVLQDMRRDPADFARRLAAELQQRDGGAPEKTDQYPEPDLVSPDGKLKTYSDATLQQMFEIRDRQVEARVMAKLKPVMEFHQTEQDRQAQAEKSQQVKSLVERTLSEARKLPHFTKENEPRILELLQDVDPETRQAIGPIAAMYLAYNQFLAESVFPGIDAAAEAKVRASNTRKAAASNGQVHPTDHGGDGKPQTLDNPTQLARHMERLAAQGTA
jgi:hypothetical protein